MSSRPTRAIGIDVGGTKISAGVMRLEDGVVTMRQERPTRADRPGSAVLDDVVALARKLHEDSGLLVPIGLGVCELVSPAGVITSDFTLPWLGSGVRDRLNALAHAVVESDVRAHARAEARYGAGRALDPFVFVSVGTGISSCLVQGGVPYAGARGNALVLATGPVSVIGPDGLPVRFVLEEYASGAALARRYGAERVEQIFADARAGSSRAELMLRDAGAMLGAAVGWLASVTDPAAVILGGGLGTADGPYWNAFEPAVRAHIWSDETRMLRIQRAALGPDAGIVGAALSAVDALD